LELGHEPFDYDGIQGQKIKKEGTIRCRRQGNEIAAILRIYPVADALCEKQADA
jgi:hypothetical protein